MSVAIVTGTAGGLGAAIAATLAREGHCVVGVDLTHGDNSALARQYDCDLTDHGALPALIRRIEDEVGPIGVLVNNAAYYKATPFMDLTAAQIERTLAVNVTAVLVLCQAVAARMATRGGGAIVNVASIAGRRGSSQIDYGASKAAVINLTVTMARLLARDGIRVNAVAPALVDSGMGSRLPPTIRDSYLQQTPLGRGARPEEIAEVVAFLAGDKASYVTGETVDIHGGL